MDVFCLDLFIPGPGLIINERYLALVDLGTVRSN
jgi:hypothetical protein